MYEFDDWAIGKVLTDEEWESVDAENRLTEVYATAAQADAGTPFTEPDQAESLGISAEGAIFETVANDWEFDGEQHHIFWGVIRDDSALAGAIADQILTRKHHVAAALNWKFDISRFAGWNIDVISALPELFWFRIDQSKPDVISKLIEKLEKDPFYRTLSRFLAEPNSQEFAAYRDEIEQFGDFSFLYSGFMNTERARL